MGDKRGKQKFAVACVAALAGAALAAAVASAQDPGDYQPPPTTTTGGTTVGGSTTVGAPGGDSQLAFRADATGSGKLGAYVKVAVYCDESCFANAYGRLRLTNLKRRGGGKVSSAFKLGTDDGQIDDGFEKFRLKVPNSARKLVKRTKPHGGRVRAKVTVTAADATGNTGRERLRLNFRDRK